MSLRRFGTGIFRFTREIILRLRGVKIRMNILPALKQTIPNMHQFSSNVFVQFNSRQPSRVSFYRMIRLLMRSISTRGFIRPFSTLDHNRLRFYDRQPIGNRFRPLIGYHRQSAMDRIKDLFLSTPRYNSDLMVNTWPNSLTGYEIGSNIACGCYAAVYELRLRRFQHNSGHDAAPSVSESAVTKSVKDPFTEYPLALKLMFNYQFDAPERVLWQSMGTELIPLASACDVLRGHRANFIPLPRSHPNVVRMFNAFTDRMPILEDAQRLYPEAIPSVNFYELSFNEPKTLCIVMKRYRMTLREYVLTQKRNYWTCSVMFGQLLEAIVYLYDHTVCHRDMKSDNILLDFNSDDEVPHLVLSDFGCALSTGSWIVHYFDETVDIGGNVALRAPEIRCAKPGPLTYIDFGLADLWAAGTIGYEIFTRINPFYNQIKSYNYIESDLPALPKRIHCAIKAVIKRILKRNPAERPNPHVAANVLGISLFRFGEDIRQVLWQCGLEESILGQNTDVLRNAFSRTLRLLGKKLSKTLDDVAMLYAAETIIARSLEPKIISTAELQLRATFLSRLDKEHVWSALDYFYADDDCIN
ncbi:hypothetical protein AB6A40_003179 [Gnathostoma spinigerum]|uniref:non-specific serine/threonine protein kinase n=1 Tax=Gnathostoma spinigerum TaxID=75299 RepID=A0ABD6EJM0_9BILA